MKEWLWRYADTKNSMEIGLKKESFLLVPKEFQYKYGPVIGEPCYKGDGWFRRYEIFTLIAEWNREYIPEMIKDIEAGIHKWPVNKKEETELMKFFRKEPSDFPLSLYGQIMAGFDEDNWKLKYPIKIVEFYSPYVHYEDVKPSEVIEYTATPTLYCAYVTKPTGNYRAEFSYKKVPILEQKNDSITVERSLPISSICKSSVLNKSEIEKKIRTGVYTCVYYTTSESKCIAWLLEEKDNVLREYKGMYESILRADIKSLY